MTRAPLLTLSDGHVMPQLGFGVWQVPVGEAPTVVGEAIKTGYRLIDTAAGYANEEGVGRAVAESNVPRADLFITTKLTNSDHGYDSGLQALDTSLKKLGMDYVDLYLIHWPRPAIDLYVDTWKALIRLKEEGRAKSIGVSNFTPAHIDRLVAETGVTPVLNQIELHPRFQQAATRAHDASHKVVTQSWSPLGRGGLTDNPVLAEIGARHGKSWAQVIIRWNLQCGLSVIPKSVTPGRIRANFDVLDFELSPEEMDRIAALDRADGREGPDPETMNRA